MRTLGLNLDRCPNNLQDNIRKARPQLACFKVISLISKRDVSVLGAYHQSRMQNESAMCFELGSPNWFENSIDDETYDTFWTVGRDFSQEAKARLPFPIYTTTSQERLPKENKFSGLQTMRTTARDTATRSSQTQALQTPERPGSVGEDERPLSEFRLEGEEGHLSCSDHDSGDGCVQQEPEVDEVDTLLRKRKLDPSRFKTVKKEINSMKTFYLSEFNHKRRSPKMTSSTWAKYLERIVTFLSFAARKLNVSPALARVDNITLVESFVDHLRTHRRVQGATAANYIHSLVTVSKFLHVDASRRDYEEVAGVCGVRALRNQLEKAQVVTKSMPSVRLFWPQYQELVRKLHCKYEEASHRLVKTRLHMNFTMLLLFSVNPGRGKELRSLRLLKEMPEKGVQDLVRRLPEDDNVIIVADHGPVWLIEKGYKTCRKYGPNVVELNTEFEFLSYHLKEYSNTSRPRLISSEDSHDYFFVNKRGMPFKSAASFSKYLAKLFKVNIGFPCSINEMRHALVEHFRSSPESSNSRLAESLARVCKHSLRTQISIYDRRTEPERRSQALRYLNRSAVNFILDEPPAGNSKDLGQGEATVAAAEEEREDEGEEEEQEEDNLPSPGEMCALVASGADPKNPNVFLAKVLKYTANGIDARLAWFKELETRPSFYEFQVGTDVWQEKASALIYPVDVVFHRREGLYELRTAKEQICALVCKSSSGKQ